VPGIDVVPLTTVLGAEITGVALAPDMDDGVVARVRAALLHHKVVFLRGQSLGPAALAGVARRFGEPTAAHPVEPSVEGHPEVLSLDADEGARADVWHSDLTFERRPPMGAMLHAQVVPAVGGDTLWSDMAATYGALSPAIRQFLETLTASHTPAKASGYFAQRDPDGDRATATAAVPAAHHPVVRVHPETGGRSVFVNPLFTDRIDGLRRRESEALLDLVQEVATRPEHVVRWHWRAGDVAFWDNRCTMHYALLGFRGPRQMQRVALEGDEPAGVARPG